MPVNLLTCGKSLNSLFKYFLSRARYNVFARVELFFNQARLANYCFCDGSE